MAKSTHVAADPETVVDRRPFRRVLVARRHLPGLRERFCRFRRAVAACGNERVAIGNVQLRQSPALCFCGLDLVRVGQRREQRLRSAISGISVVGAKPSGRARGWRELRRGGRSIGRAWRGKRRNQLVAASALLLRDADGGW